MQALAKAGQYGLQGTVQVPGDKSISHRALMFGAIAAGQTEVHDFLPSADVYSTMAALRALGVQVEEKEHDLVVTGRGGFQNFHAPKQALDFGNSGTSTRLLMGLLAAQPFDMAIEGDASLSKRPLKRVSEPLNQMGARFDLRDGNYLPGTIRASAGLKAIDYDLPVASAQVKSALIFAGMQAEGTTRIVSPLISRDHTERMLRKFGGQIKVAGKVIEIAAQPQLEGQVINVPGDISSAAFFLVAGLITPNSKLRLKKVGINPTRTGVITLLERMGAQIKLDKFQDDAERVADLLVESQPLHGIEIGAADIPAAVDELPILALAAACAQGQTIISGAEELRVKESDRIAEMVKVLQSLGVDVEEKPDGMVIKGGRPLKTAKPEIALSANGDHRLAMVIAVAALVTDGQVNLLDPEAMRVSYPNFLQDLRNLMKVKE